MIPVALLGSQPTWAQASDSAPDDARNDVSQDDVEELIVRGRKPSS